MPSLITFNVCGHPRMRPAFTVRAAEICRRVEALRPHLLTLQEVFTAGQLATVRAGLPSLPHAAYLRNRLGQPRGGLVTLAAYPLTAPEFVSFRGTARGIRGRFGSARAMRVAVQVGTKGALVTRSGHGGVTVANVHPSPNPDGDWTDGNRFAGMHRAQFDVLGAACDRLGVDVLCGDFNLSAGSELFHRFRAASGWIDAFGDTGEPTFHSQFLGPGRPAHRIDFVLTRPGSSTVDSAERLFTGPVPMRDGTGYVSDHVALHVSLSPGHLPQPDPGP